MSHMGRKAGRNTGAQLSSASLGCLNRDGPSTSPHSESHVDRVWLQVRRLKYVGMEGKIMIFLSGEMLDGNHFYPVQTSGLIL